MTGLIHTQTHKLTALLSGLLFVSLLCPFLDAETASQWNMGKSAQLFDRTYKTVADVGNSCMNLTRKGYKLGINAAILICRDVSDIRNIDAAGLKKAAMEALNRIGAAFVMAADETKRVFDREIETAIRDGGSDRKKSSESPGMGVMNFLSEDKTANDNC